MIDEKYKDAMTLILSEDPRYDIQAYDFVNEALTRTIEKIKKGRPPGQRHLTGAELLTGILEFAVAQYGDLAAEVMEYWNLNRGSDVGNVVYNMIRHGIMSASPEDKQEDFDCVGSIPERLENTRLSSIRSISLPPPPKIM